MHLFFFLFPFFALIGPSAVRKQEERQKFGIQQMLLAVIEPETSHRKCGPGLQLFCINPNLLKHNGKFTYK